LTRYCLEVLEQAG